MKGSVSSADQDKGFKRNEKLRKIGSIILILILLISSFLAFKAFAHKSKTEQTQIVNTVENKLTVDYSAVVNPSIL